MRFPDLMDFTRPPGAAYGDGTPRQGERGRNGERTVRLTRFAHHVDLMRTGRLSSAEVELLEAAGVGSVAELAVSSPDELRARMAEIREGLETEAPVPSLCRVRGLVLRAALRAGDSLS